MKKIYLMGLSAVFALSANAQTTLKLKNTFSKNEGNQNSTSKVAQVVSTITSNTQYVAGTTMDLVFTYQAFNTDFEYVDYLAITFPTGITPTGLANTSNPFPNTEDPGGGLEPLNPIAGQVISWGVNNNDQYGGIYSSTGISFTVNVTIGAGVTGSLTASFDASGDGYGASPGNQLGSTFIIYPAGTALVDMKTKFVLPTTITAINNCGMGMSPIFARFVNLSTDPQSNFSVNYSVNGAASTSTIIAGPLAVGDSVDVTFASSFDFTPSNMYNIKAWVAQSGDINLSNDTAALTISNSVSVPLTSASYTNGVESLYEYGSVNKTWIGTGLAFYADNADMHSGAFSFNYNIPTTIGAPAGTYTAVNIYPCVDVVTGETYRISWWNKVDLTPVSNGMIAITTGTAQTSAGTSTVLRPYTTIVPGVWVKDSVDYVAAVSGTRYFAVRGQGTLSATSAVSVKLDDFQITKVTSSVGLKTNTSNDAISIFPNPTSGILNVTAVEVASSIEVFNVIGEKVYSNTLVKGNNVVDLSGLSNGAYFVKMNSNGQITTKKVVLSK